LWYVYFLELSNGDICVGSTNDLRRRFSTHQEGSVASTCKYLPVTLRSYIAVTDEASARELERYFKSGSGKGLSQEAFPAEDQMMAVYPASAPKTWVKASGDAPSSLFP
jgi:putative endonuclease